MRKQEGDRGGEGEGEAGGGREAVGVRMGQRRWENGQSIKLTTGKVGCLKFIKHAAGTTAYNTSYPASYLPSLPLLSGFFSFSFSCSKHIKDKCTLTLSENRNKRERERERVGGREKEPQLKIKSREQQWHGKFLLDKWVYMEGHLNVILVLCWKLSFHSSSNERTWLGYKFVQTGTDYTLSTVWNKKFTTPPTHQNASNRSFQYIFDRRGMKQTRFSWPLPSKSSIKCDGTICTMQLHLVVESIAF